MGNESKNYRYHTVVLIDDNEVDNLINQKLMKSSNFAKFIYTYTSGKSALEFFKNIDKNEDFPAEMIPELILLDINMPIMNGFSFLESFQKLSTNITNNTKIVLLTSSVNPQDIQRADEIDFIIEYISKPLNKEKLKKVAI